MMITLAEGKYTVLYSEDLGVITGVLRHGEPWRDVTGDKFVLALVHRVVALQEALGGFVNTEAHDQTCRISTPGRGCDCGAAAHRAEARTNALRVLRDT